jgi:hypothetical protein
MTNTTIRTTARTIIKGFRDLFEGGGGGGGDAISTIVLNILFFIFFPVVYWNRSLDKSFGWSKIGKIECP